MSHFVPHLRVVQERLKTFLQSSSVSHALQPAPPVRIGALNLQLASSNPAPQKTPPTMDLLSYIQSKVKIPVYSDPDSDDEPYLGTNLALGGPHGAGAQYIALGRLTSVPVKLRKRSGRRRSRRQRRTPIPSDKESLAPSDDEMPLLSRSREALSPSTAREASTPPPSATAATPPPLSATEAPPSQLSATEAPPSQLSSSEAPPLQPSASEAPSPQLSTSKAPPPQLSASEAPPPQLSVTEAPPPPSVTPEPSSPAVTLSEPQSVSPGDTHSELPPVNNTTVDQTSKRSVSVPVPPPVSPFVPKGPGPQFGQTATLLSPRAPCPSVGPQTNPLTALPVCVSACIPICMSACLSASILMHLSTPQSSSPKSPFAQILCQTACWSACLCVCQLICQSLGLPYFVPVCLSVCLYACLPICLSM